MAVMQKFMALFKQIKLKLRLLFPIHLPYNGMTEFEEFYQLILSTYKLPDYPSYKQAIATMVMHLEPTESKKHISFFGRALKKSMANQVAYEVIDLIREADKTKKQQLKQEADQQLVASVDKPIQN